jgi:ParB-like chromosome segregation protein Spo0J
VAKVSKVWKGNADLEPLLVPIAELMLDPANVRKHGDRNRETIKASLMRYGQQKVIVIDKQGIVRAGNGTMAEARELGWTHLAVTRSDLTTTDLVGYAVADNRTAELATWDDSALADTLKALEADGFDLDAAGFNSAELDELIGKLTVPNFEPVGIDEQGKLDEKAKVECPDCGCQFTP